MVIKGQYFNGHVASQDLILWNYVPLIVGGEETDIISYTIKVTILVQSPSQGQWLETEKCTQPLGVLLVQNPKWCVMGNIYIYNLSDKSLLLNRYLKHDDIY